jgi:hypothetical protein
LADKSPASVLNLKFARLSDSARSELQIQKARWFHGFAGVAGDSEIRSVPSIRSGEFPNRHTSPNKCIASLKQLCE